MVTGTISDEGPERLRSGIGVPQVLRREHGPVDLPGPPGGATTLEAAFDATIERFAREA